MPDGSRRAARLRWRCRRGLKELDVLMERLLASGRLAAADERELDGLERLLDLPDPELLELLAGRTPPPDDDMARAVRFVVGG